MITADRRGHIAGSQEARKYPQGLPDVTIERMASTVFAIMRHAGFAHIEPRDMFIAGFVSGFKTTQQMM